MLPDARTGIKLATAQGIAKVLRESLSPFCQRIEIAGSIRREKPLVGDIELVLIPTWEKRLGSGQQGLFDPVIEEVNLLHEYLSGIAKSGRFVPIHPRHHSTLDSNWETKAKGKLWKFLVVEEGVKVDIFITDAERWGMTFMIRTGSAEFSERMAIRWKDLTHGKGRWEDSHLVTGSGNVISCPRESDVFKHLKVPWIEPRERLGAEAIQAAIGREGLTRS